MPTPETQSFELKQKTNSDGSVQLGIRRTVFDKHGRFCFKQFAAIDGSLWINVGEGRNIPDACLLDVDPVMIDVVRVRKVGCTSIQYGTLDRCARCPLWPTEYMRREDFKLLDGVGEWEISIEQMSPQKFERLRGDRDA